MAPIVGYRKWMVDTRLHRRLPKAIINQYIWTAGINTATCDDRRLGGSERCENSPGNCAGDNGCGFHAFHDLSELEPGTMAGIVVGGGQVVVHCNAWRAEQAMVVAMVDMGMWSLRSPTTIYTRRTLDEFARYFGVRVVPAAMAEVVAAEYGQRVDPELRPLELRAVSEERG